MATNEDLLNIVMDQQKRLAAQEKATVHLMRATLELSYIAKESDNIDHIARGHLAFEYVKKAVDILSHEPSKDIGGHDE